MGSIRKSESIQFIQFLKMASESDHESDSYNDYYSDSSSDSNSDSNPIELALEPSSKASRITSSRPKHSIGARIQAITFLELNIPHFEITAKTGISKAQIYKLREKALSRGWDPKVSSIIEVFHIEDTLCSRRPKTP